MKIPNTVNRITSIIAVVVGLWLITACGSVTEEKYGGLSSPVPSKERVRVLIAGDSTVSTWTPERPERGWGQVISSYFDERVEFDNRAVPGRSTRTFISEGDWGKLLKSLKPGDYVLIQFGHNDSHDPSSPEATAPFGDYRDFLIQYVDDARAKGATPILVTPMYRREFDQEGDLQPYLTDSDGNPIYNLRPYAEAMRQVAAEKGVGLVDLFSMSGELLQELGDTRSAQLLAPNDRAHWNHRGAAVMAFLVARGLVDVESSLESYVRSDDPLTEFGPEVAEALGASG